MAIRLLIVDDNIQFLRAASDLLDREGARILGVASTGRDALQQATELRPDAVLVDVDLGSESGFDVATRLVEELSVRVVLISAYPEGEFGDLIAACPAAGFVSKADLSARAVEQIVGDPGRPEDR
jgi:two-component system, NarL family, nitrate/nitrite response regulator NarL